MVAVSYSVFISTQQLKNQVTGTDTHIDWPKLLGMKPTIFPTWWFEAVYHRAPLAASKLVILRCTLFMV